MLGASMMNQVGGEVDCIDVIAINKSGFVNGMTKLMKKPSKLRALSNGAGHATIVRLSAGSRNRGMSLIRPQDKQ